MRAILILMVSLLVGCSAIERNTIGLFDSSQPPANPSPRSRAHLPAIQNETTSVSVDTIETTGNNSLIEIVWTVPSEPVDAFIIHYGENQNALDNEIKVASDSLERFEDSDNRALYRYVMGDLPKDKPIYFAIASVREDSVSPNSPVYTVAPEE